MHAHRRIPALVACAALTSLAAPAFAAPYDYTEPPIIVTEASATEAELITSDVVDALANDPRLAGRIGVQTMDREVELTGIVTSAGQSRQAERDAKAVYRVRNVRNKLATRIGGY